jgi:hypothetical protein
MLLNENMSLQHENIPTIDTDPSPRIEATTIRKLKALERSQPVPMESHDDESSVLANALSSSLACIAATGNSERARAKAERSQLNGSEDGFTASSLSGSDAQEGETAVVTATSITNTSSGDDRDSSGAAGNNKSSSADDRDSSEGGKAGPLTVPTAQTMEIHDHQQRQRNIPSTDVYGLPITLNDRVHAQNALTHATVFAHLPPPSADSLSCSGSGESHADSGFHSIRKTFNTLMQQESTKNSQKTHSSSDHSSTHKRIDTRKRAPITALSSKEVKANKRRARVAWRSDIEDDVVGSGSSSGSGTEGGYAGSASSYESSSPASPQENSSSPAVSFSSESPLKQSRKSSNYFSGDPARQLLNKRNDSLSISSDITDFSSGNSEGETSSMDFLLERVCALSEQEEPQVACYEAEDMDTKPAARPKVAIESESLLSGKPPITALGCDVMAHVLTFLEPPETMEVLTMPLSKDWLTSFTRQPELWRVLCLMEPFQAKIGEDDDDSSDDDDDDSFPVDVSKELRLTFGKSRMLYTSFVRCIRYLARIKDDALNGRALTAVDFGASTASTHKIGKNQNLKDFLARAKGSVDVRKQDADERLCSDISDDESNTESKTDGQGLACVSAIGVSDDGSQNASPIQKCRKRDESDESKQVSKKPKFAQSHIAQRLLAPPTTSSAPVLQELPWSCAIYSIVNWMAAYSDVEGIQTMCLKVLPFLLEDEQQRSTAQHAGLTDIVLRDMVLFPNSAQLHTAAFHTIVLLARPLGGREGMLFHTSMVNSSGIVSTRSDGQGGKNGVAVMLDSMRRFQNDEELQAMSCWSLVNIALAPAQKEVLVKLGGIEVTANAMMAHPFNAEVQFRALFALINLVIPSVGFDPDGDVGAPALAEDESSEREMLDESVEQIVGLVVTAMKNFCSSEAILNRACLVLHNLSLTQEYHGALLAAPNCYQMLEWCLGNFLTDQVLQQSAAGTLHRLQITLSSNETLRTRFSATLQSQQKLSLEQAHREAVILRDQQEDEPRPIQDSEIIESGLVLEQ